MTITFFVFGHPYAVGTLTMAKVAETELFLDFRVLHYLVHTYRTFK